MEYCIYKLDFQTEVHFGNGMLNESVCTFGADQLFSALYIEALKWDKQTIFYDAVKKGKLLFSDMLPYVEERYMVPKPMVYVEPADRGRSEQKKQMKKLKFLPIEDLECFLAGTLELTEEDPMNHFGTYQQKTRANVSGGEETVPYRVGTFSFNENCGLYVIVAYQNMQERNLIEELLESLSYTGIGGKKSSGLGKFILRKGKMPEKLLQRLNSKANRYMLLSAALPEENELDEAMKGASYLLEKRSGFVASPAYAEEWRRKRDLFVFAEGSCFATTFHGDIYDVSNGGKHPVFRYAKALFLGV